METLRILTDSHPRPGKNLHVRRVVRTRIAQQPACSHRDSRDFARRSLLSAWIVVTEEDVLRDIAHLLAKRKSRSEMIAEFLREISVLVLVFAPLDALFNPGASSWSVIAALVGFALAVGYVGIRIEESRR